MSTFLLLIGLTIFFVQDLFTLFEFLALIALFCIAELLAQIKRKVIAFTDAKEV